MPRLRTVARRTLSQPKLSLSIYRYLNDILFGVIGRVCENAWIKSTPHTIQALHSKPVLICFHEVIIKYLIPHLVHQVPTAMSKNFLLLASGMDSVLYTSRKLQKTARNKLNTAVVICHTYRRNVCNMMGSRRVRFASEVLREVGKIHI